MFWFSKREKSSVFLAGSVSPRNRGVSTTTIVRSELSEHQARMKSEGMNELFKRSVKGVRRKRRKEGHRVGQGLDHYITFLHRYVLMLDLCNKRPASASPRRLEMRWDAGHEPEP